MDSLKLSEQLEDALTEYRRYSSRHLQMMDLDCFSDSLCSYAWEAKAKLRDMLRKSQYWDEELQACAVPFRRDFSTARKEYIDCTFNLLMASIPEYNLSLIQDLRRWLNGFPTLELEDKYPNIFRSNGKKSRIIRKFLIETGKWQEDDEVFMKYYIKLADALSKKVKDDILYLSIHPAHFMTMSNPVGDPRGRTLASCHSLDNNETNYNGGCAGYAMDKITMIAFTANTPDLNGRCTRKTLRQLFMYKPQSGVLLQSRLYDTAGGTRGYQEISGQLRRVVEEIINEAEGETCWEESNYNYHSDYRFFADLGFSGYPDWEYSDYNPRLAVKEDCPTPEGTEFTIGTNGICLCCGEETSNDEGIYCVDCYEEREYLCDRCGAECCADELTEIPSRDMAVCPSCLEDHYRYCDYCGEYHDADEVFETEEDKHICSSCKEDRNFEICEDCGNVITFREYQVLWGGEEAVVCGDCLNSDFITLKNGDRCHIDDPIHDCPNCGGIVYGDDEEELCEECKK